MVQASEAPADERAGTDRPTPKPPRHLSTLLSVLSLTLHCRAGRRNAPATQPILTREATVKKKRSRLVPSVPDPGGTAVWSRIASYRSQSA